MFVFSSVHLFYSPFQLFLFSFFVYSQLFPFILVITIQYNSFGVCALYNLLTLIQIIIALWKDALHLTKKFSTHSIFQTFTLLTLFSLLPSSPPTFPGKRQTSLFFNHLHLPFFPWWQFIIPSSLPPSFVNPSATWFFPLSILFSIFSLF